MVDGRDKAITLFGEGVDEGGVGGAVIQDGTDLANTEVQALVDVDVDAFLPDVVAELFAGDDVGSTGYEKLEHAEGLGLQLERDPVARQDAAPGVELIVPKANGRRQFSLLALEHWKMIIVLCSDSACTFEEAVRFANNLLDCLAIRRRGWASGFLRIALILCDVM